MILSGCAKLPGVAGSPRPVKPESSPKEELVVQKKAAIVSKAILETHFNLHSAIEGQPWIKNDEILCSILPYERHLFHVYPVFTTYLCSLNHLTMTVEDFFSMAINTLDNARVGRGYVRSYWL